MYAVIETGGKQYRVELGTELAVERIGANPGETISFERVLLVADGDSTHIGTPVVADALVTASVVRQDRGDKVVVFKYRPKARHRAKKGHRQELTVIRVADIQFNGRSAAEAAGAQEKEQAKARRAAAAEAKRKAETDQALADKLAQEAAERAEKEQAEKAAETAAKKLAAVKKPAAKAKAKPTAEGKPTAEAKPAAKKATTTKPAATTRAAPAAKTATVAPKTGATTKPAAKPTTRSTSTRTKKDS
jgi:large subunit ribosomal protein L21